MPSFTQSSATEFLESKQYHVIEFNDKNVKVKCDTCETDCVVTKASVRNAFYNNLKPAFCKVCKNNKKQNDFRSRNGFTYGEDFHTKNFHIKCDKEGCGLTYNFNSESDLPHKFTCYCQLSSKRADRAFYEIINKSFPHLFMNKEQDLYGKHKSDIYIYEEETNFKLHIEVDESNHFYTTNISCKKDLEVIDNYDYYSDIKLLHIENHVSPKVLLKVLNKIRDDEKKIFFLENPGKTRYHDLYKDNQNYDQLVFFEYKTLEEQQKPKLTILITV